MINNQTYFALQIHPDYQEEMLKRQELAIKEGRLYVLDEKEAQDLFDTLGPREISEEQRAEIEFYNMLSKMTEEEAQAVIEHYAKLGEDE